MNRNSAILLIITSMLVAFGCQQKGKSVSGGSTSVEKMPGKENLWIFLMAGQSNMAGRGVVEAEDTLTNARVLVLDSNNVWTVAKEPLHFYEPARKGLDCGLSFGKALAGAVKDPVYIGLVPCAIGGSSVEQWLGDSLYRGVKLYSNFDNKVKKALEAGTLKGILWHQGESNAHEKQFLNYESNLKELFKRFRSTAGNDSLPILAGELGHFLEGKDFGQYPDALNQVLHNVAKTEKRISVVSAAGLNHKGDSLHFNSASLRLLGERFAEEYISLTK
jgi:hypothetical protein